MRHPTTEQIVCFAAGRADESLVERIYQHLAECDVCTEQYRVAQQIREDFEGSWEEFLRQAERLLRSDSSSAGLQSIASLVVRGWVDAGKRLATSCQEVWDGGKGWSAGLVPSFGGVGSPDATPAVAAHLEEASSCLERGEFEKVRTELEEAGRDDASAAGVSRLDLEFEGEPAGHVYVQAEERIVNVMLRPEIFTNRRIEVGLAGLGAEAVEWVQLRPVEGAGFLLAEFEDVPDGAFNLRFREVG